MSKLRDNLRELVEGLGEKMHAFFLSLVKDEELASFLVTFADIIIFSFIVIITCLLIMKITNILFKKINQKIESWRGTIIRPIKMQTFEIVTADRLTDILKWFTNKIKIVVYCILFYIFIPILLSYFPGSRAFILKYLDYLIMPFIKIFEGIIAFIPNLIFIVLTIYIVRYLIKLMRVIFAEIDKGKIKFPGFHQDWADPTFKLLRILAIVLAVVLISPYMPGFGSPAFQGISIFFGLLLSLGSTAAIANMVAGVSLTYMSPFKIGDRVKIADTMGDVVEKTLLITRVRTIKNVEVTIPNSMVLGSHMINFSALARESRLILHTTVTIGYDAPWRQVHECLLEAAHATHGVIPEPAPFVLQTSLNDFSVTYELNVYTADAAHLLGIQSELHAKIQDKFNEAGIEIMSPSYSAIRDGNEATIPETYLPKTYEAKSFRIAPLEDLIKLKETPSSG